MNEQWIVPILTGTSVISIGGSLLVARLARRAPLQARLSAIGGGGGTATIAVGPGASGGTRLVDLVQGVGSSVAGGKASSGLRESLTRAGYHDAGAVWTYMGAKTILMIAGALGTAIPIFGREFAPVNKMLMVGVATGIAFFLPNLTVAGRRRRRTALIRRHLPDAIDLLEICCSAGMGLDQAWNAVTDEVRTVCPTLADEMALTNLEIHLGATRTDAMKHMATRTGAEELSSLVAMLLQAERFGSSIAEGLQAYATYMRETRSQTMQEAAEKMAIKLIIPMVVCIFPAVVMLMAGPAFISLYRATRPG